MIVGAAFQVASSQYGVGHQLRELQLGRCSTSFGALEHEAFNIMLSHSGLKNLQFGVDSGSVPL